MSLEEQTQQIRFGTPEGETEADGWHFDGLDYVREDEDANKWVFDGTEYAIKDDSGYLHVERHGEWLVKDPDTSILYRDEEFGDLTPVGSLTSSNKANGCPSRKDMRSANEMDRKQSQLLTESVQRKLLEVWLTLDEKKSHELGIRRSRANILSIISPEASREAVRAENLRQLQHICRRIYALSQRGTPTAADAVLAAVSHCILNLFDPSEIEANPSSGGLRPSLTSILFHDNKLAHLSSAMQKRLLSILRNRLKSCLRLLSELSTAHYTAADVCVYHLSESLRILLTRVSRDIKFELHHL